jgi:hypothetical protein
MSAWISVWSSMSRPPAAGCSTLTYSSFIRCASAAAAFSTSFTRGAMYTWPAGAPDPETRGSRSIACCRRWASAAGLEPGLLDDPRGDPALLAEQRGGQVLDLDLLLALGLGEALRLRTASCAFSVIRLGSMTT